MSGYESSHVSVFLAELDRQRALGVDPWVSTLFVKAPPTLRRGYLDGHVSEEDFWDRLRQWLIFDEGPSGPWRAEPAQPVSEPEPSGPSRLQDLARRATRGDGG